MLTTAAASMTGTDLLLLTTLALWGFYLALAQGCPLIVLSPIPIIATADFASLQFPGPPDPPPPSRIVQRLRRRLNRFIYHSVNLLKCRHDSRVIQVSPWQRLGAAALGRRATAGSRLHNWPVQPCCTFSAPRSWPHLPTGRNRQAWRAAAFWNHAPPLAKSWLATINILSITADVSPVPPEHGGG